MFAALVLATAAETAVNRVVLYAGSDAAYRGLAILTTNYKQALDPAFLRQ